MDEGEQRSSQKGESAGDVWRAAASSVLGEHGVPWPVNLIFHAPVFSDEARYGVSVGLIGVSAGNEEATAGDFRTTAFLVANAADQTGDLVSVRQSERGWVGKFESVWIC